MKKFIMAMMATAMLLTTGTAVFAEADTEVSVFSRHVWRGAAGTDAVSIQPQVTVPIETNAGTTTVSVWGSIPITDGGGDTEYDFIVSQPVGGYGTVDITSYTFGGPLLESDTHEVEVAFSTSYADVDLLLGRFVNGDRVKDDTYVELGYELAGIGLTLGAGDGAYTVDGDFTVVNTALSVSNEDYGASLIYNPDSETTYFVVSTTW
tara:strand:- start:1312 stop:1932 length:621 start_codon:yes stop_codon:yes gene_type:complete